MKKAIILLALILIGAAGYYLGFGSEKITNELKLQVDRQLQTLQKNGFEIEDRKIEAEKEHFVIHYAHPEKIAQYFRSKNIDISNEDAEFLHGLKLGVDLSYLEGVYSAISADIYPTAITHSLRQEISRQGEKQVEKLIKEKAFLAHIDINKLFTSFKGHLKDINATFTDVESLTLVSRGFKFEGSYDDQFLTSSSNSVKELSMTDDSGSKFILKNLEGSYEHSGKSMYDFVSRYTIESLRVQDEKDQGMSAKKLLFKSSGKAEKGLASSSFSLHIKSIDIKEPGKDHYLEDVNSKGSLEHLSVAALDEMKQLDANDTEGFNEAFRKLLAGGITMKMDEFSIKKVREGSGGKMIDGFLINADAKIDKVKDFKQLEENPFLILDIITATMHMEFSDTLYIELQKRPELAIATILFTPIPKNGKMIFDIEYKDGSLKINGKPVI